MGRNKCKKSHDYKGAHGWEQFNMHLMSVVEEGSSKKSPRARATLHAQLHSRVAAKGPIVAEPTESDAKVS